MISPQLILHVNCLYNASFYQQAPGDEAGAESLMVCVVLHATVQSLVGAEGNINVCIFSGIRE